jgi:hypothetical protein
MKLRASQIHDVYLSDSKSNYVAKASYRRGYIRGFIFGMMTGAIIYRVIELFQ